jgi:glycosidase
MCLTHRVRTNLILLWALVGLLGTSLTFADHPPDADASYDGEVFYHVFVRSFRDGNDDQIGDLDGLREGLDYIEKLGVTAILLTPVQPSPFYHNYFATSFTDVAAEYGGTRAWFEFVEAAHRRGLKIYMDIEFQYVAGGHPWLESAWHQPLSPYRSWLRWNDAAAASAADADPLASPFGLFAGAADGSRHAIALVDLNQAATKAYFRDYLLHWADPHGDGSGRDGVDGYRIDHMMDDLDHLHVVSHLFSDFWAPTIAAVKARRSHIRFLGEQSDWGYGTDCLIQGEADSVFAFPLRGALITMRKDVILKEIASTQSATPSGKRQVLFLENHDTDRLMTVVGGDPAKTRAAAAMLLMLDGDPSIYYGQELGMQGRQGPSENSDAPDIPRREAFRWTADLEAKGSAIWYSTLDRIWAARANHSNDGISVQEEANDPNSLLSWYQQLILYRRQHSEVRNGAQSFPCAADSSVLCLLRADGSKRTLLLVNLSDAPAVPEIDAYVVALDFRLVAGEGGLTAPLARYGVRILETR